jgi:hypothetical protein
MHTTDTSKQTAYAPISLRLLKAKSDPDPSGWARQHGLQHPVLQHLFRQQQYTNIEMQSTMDRTRPTMIPTPPLRIRMPCTHKPIGESCGCVPSGPSQSSALIEAGKDMDRFEVFVKFSIPKSDYKIRTW